MKNISGNIIIALLITLIPIVYLFIFFPIDQICDKHKWFVGSNILLFATYLLIARKTMIVYRSLWWSLVLTTWITIFHKFLVEMERNNKTSVIDQFKNYILDIESNLLIILGNASEYAFYAPLFISIFVAIYIYLDTKQDAEAKDRHLEELKDASRNVLEDFSAIFAKQFKLMLDIKHSQNNGTFYYMNFFLNFGEIHCLFESNRKAYYKQAHKLGLESKQKYQKIKQTLKYKREDYKELSNEFDLEIDNSLFDELDFSKMEHAVKIFKLLLFEKINCKTSSFKVLLTGDTNEEINYLTDYQNKEYHITIIIINIIVGLMPNDHKLDEKKQKDLWNVGYIKKMIEQKQYSKQLAASIYRELDDFIKKKNKTSMELDIEKLHEIAKHFDIAGSMSKEKDIEELNTLLLKQYKGSISDDEKRKLKELKSKYFPILEAIYKLYEYLLKEKEDPLKGLAYYIMYSKQINKILTNEFRPRKKLIEKIQKGEIIIRQHTPERRVFLFERTLFPYQGIMGTIDSNGDSTDASLIFFVGGDTVGKVPEGYYSEHDRINRLHRNAFDNIIESHIKKSFFHINIVQSTDIIDNKIGKIEKIHTPHKACIDNDELKFLLIFSALNYRFWINGTKYWGDGASELYKRLKDIFYSNINKSFAFSKFNSFFSFCKNMKVGSQTIPDCKKRKKFIKEVLAFIDNQYRGSVPVFIEECDYDALKIVRALTELEAFEDKIDDLIVAKKATFFIKKLLEIEEYAEKIKNIEKLNILADYRIPQYLREIGVFSYSLELRDKVDNKVIIEKNSLYEKEIRMATIEFGQILLKRYNPDNDPNGINILDIDTHLWRQAKEKEKEFKHPFHLTETSCY